MEKDAGQNEPHAEADECRGELERVGPAREPPGRGASPRESLTTRGACGVAEAGESACGEDDGAHEQKAARDGALGREPCGAADGQRGERRERRERERRQRQVAEARSPPQPHIDRRRVGVGG